MSFNKKFPWFTSRKNILIAEFIDLILVSTVIITTLKLSFEGVYLSYLFIITLGLLWVLISYIFGRYSYLNENDNLLNTKNYTRSIFTFSFTATVTFL